MPSLYGSTDSVDMKTSRTQLTGESIGGNESWWSRRSRVEKRLLVILGLFVVGTLALAVTVGVFVQKNNDLQNDSSKSVEGTISTSTSAPIVVTDSGDTSICTSPTCVQSAAFILDGMNASVNPCYNFFEFACGNWVKNHPIPDDKERFGNFDLLAEKVKQQYKELLSAPSPTNEVEAVNKTKSMYKACLNEEKVRELTLLRVREALEKYGGWPIANPSADASTFDWIPVEASFKRDPSTPMDYASSLVNIYVSYDAKNTDKNIIYMDQPLLGLGQSYLLSPANYSTQISAYKTLINGVALYFLNGTSSATVDDQVEKMVELESEIANISMTPNDKRQKDKIYNKMTFDQLKANITQSPGIAVDWLRFANLVFQDIWPLEDSEPIIVVDWNYVQRLGAVLGKTDNKTLANYMLWRYVMPQLRHISSETLSLYNTYVKTMTGVDKPPDRWLVCANEVDGGLGMALGRMFVEKSFKGESKAEAEEMINGIQETFTDMLGKNEWMDDETRKAAKDKAMAIEKHIGYPKWILEEEELNKYYSNVTISAEDHAANLRSSAVAAVWRTLHSLRDQHADKTIWFMTPGTVNAYYVPELNSINFPAGILQIPFFQGGRMKALNYGGIGAVIGHEITHGFDDEGRQYDKNGNIAEWWNPAVIESFKNRSSCYVEQYGKYCPTDLPSGSSKCVDGTLTLGENIADNGGIKAAYEAYRTYVAKNKEEQRLPGLDKYTPDQLFFIGFGQLWCSNIRPQALLNQMLKDPHSPANYRIIGTVSNSKEFAKVYNCDESTKMNRGKERCELW